MRAKALRKDRAGFQMEAGTTETKSSKVETGWIGSVTDDNERRRIETYCIDVLKWNRAGTPSNDKLENEIESYWDKLPAVNLFLSKCGLLDNFNAETLGTIFEKWVKGNNPKKRTFDARKKVWDRVCNEWSREYPARKLNNSKIKQIYNLFVVGKYASYKNKDGVEVNKKPCSKRNELQSVQTIFAFAKRLSLIPKSLDISIDEIDPTGGDTKLLARPKQYISTARFNLWMEKLELYPDLRLFLLMMRTIGYRPGALWQHQRWDDLIYPNDDPSLQPIQINRVFAKTANKRTTSINERAIDRVVLDLPEIVAAAIVEYRKSLLEMRKRPQDFPDYDISKMPPYCQATGQFKGPLFWNWKRATDTDILKKRIFPAIGEPYFTAMPTALRASASRNIQDIGGDQVESKYLRHKEVARNRHYVSEDILHDAPPKLDRVPEGSFIQNYDLFWSIGESYYDNLSTSQKYLLSRSSKQKLDVSPVQES